MKKLIWKLQTPKELLINIPLSKDDIDFINTSREELKNIISWKDSRKILIIGPCSADFEDSLYEYAEFLSKLSKKVEDKIKIVLRFYTWKPRTVWWWKWLQNSSPWETPNLITWIENSRKIAINIIKKYRLPLADELLHPQLIEYMHDIYSYFAIWARSSENQFHREVSSWVEFPVWMKNPTSWNLPIMINSVLASNNSSVYVIWNEVFETSWNEFAHGILRWWSSWPNYNLENITSAYNLMNGKVKNKAIIVDTNHDNSCKKYELQTSIMQEVIASISDNKDLKSFVKWFMVESYLYDARQDFSENVTHWLSLTDPCIGKEKTKEFVDILYKLI